MGASGLGGVADKLTDERVTSINMVKSAKSLKRSLCIVLMGMLVALVMGCTPSHAQSTFDTLGPVAENQLFIFYVILAAGTVVFILVEGALIYMVVRFRRKGDGDPAQTHGNTRLEIIWTVIPVLILVVAAVPTIQGIFYAANPEYSDNYRGAPLEVDVIGHQWWFEFRYPNPSNAQEQITVANELFIPVGEPVSFRLDSVDVIHSFWVPKLAGKVDMIPNNDNTMWFEAYQPGEFFGQCAEFCGVMHANMRFKVIAVPRAEFDVWLARQAADAPEPSDPLAREGKDLFRTAGCSGCHQQERSIIKLRDDGSRLPGRTGPNLTHVASRVNHLGMFRNSDIEFEAGNQRQLFVNEAGLPVDAGGREFVSESMLQRNLKTWITDPEALKPGNLMARDGVPYVDPDKALSERDVDALVAYLLTLK